MSEANTRALALEPAQLHTIIAWLERAYPDEGCGLVVEHADSSVEVICCENLANHYHAQDPAAYPQTSRSFYVIDPLVILRAQRRGAKLRLIFHSHADVGDYFSEDDVLGALLPGVGDEPPSPSYPGTDYLVVSVRGGAADRAQIFGFERASARFISHTTITVEGAGAYRVEWA